MKSEEKEKYKKSNQTIKDRYVPKRIKEWEREKEIKIPTIVFQFETEIKIFGPRLRSKHLRKPLPEYFLNASRLTKDARGSFFYIHYRYREYNRYV